MPASAAPKQTILSVSQLNEKVRQHLEMHIGEIWLQGEISNLARPYSGHWYFSLKDNRAQVRCAMFKGQNRKVLFDVQDGQQVLVRARISVYEPRGEYQLIVQSMQPDGLGAMQLAYEQLRCKLAAEGLFQESRKVALPEIVNRVGVITSASGAAFHDITAVLKRLAPQIDIVLYPSPVQGHEAPESLCQALKIANLRAEVDVLIIGRGGGSLEDLWAFNYEPLARQVAASQLPIISAVGHEIDFTLTDFVADWRAPTPSAAAERIAYGQHQLYQKQTQLYQQLQKLITRMLSIHEQHFRQLQQRLSNQSPLRQLRVQQQHCDELHLRLHRALNRYLSQKQQHQEQLQKRLLRVSPQYHLRTAHRQLLQLNARLSYSYQQYIKTKQHQFSGTIQQLQALSPLATLARGYSAIQSESGQWLTHTTQFKPGMMIDIQLCDGQVRAKVDSID
ncbi:exodeoxyribonuclease VII large subunit [Celerinatantimonas sp. YJH-8]|uniref:exodeoxyribonuclease VII large subunit n=1 Tax=Celerinatantimonas sp. YJH-8 TaxID=3228714 RepID=UPI0038C16105